MTYANNKLHMNHELNCTKCQESKSGIRQLEHDVTEKEDECMLWYRRFEDAKSRKRQYSYLKRGKET